MASEASDSGTRSDETQSPSSSGIGNGDTGEFECNICFELAQDPVITLCGHLYCWPCLYRWLRLHSRSHECPVCKALIQEEKLIPLYGRGQTQTDPRSKPVPGVEIPNRPAGQRPETAPPPPQPPRPPLRAEAFGFRNSGGFLPVMMVGLGYLGVLAGCCGFLPPMLSIEISSSGGARHTIYSSTGYEYAHGFPSGYEAGNVRRAQRTNQRQEQAEDKKLISIFLIVMFLVVISCLW